MKPMDAEIGTLRGSRRTEESHWHRDNAGERLLRFRGIPNGRTRVNAAIEAAISLPALVLRNLLSVTHAWIWTVHLMHRPSGRHRLPLCLRLLVDLVREIRPLGL
jgi:hypothetical protein